MNSHLSRRDFLAQFVAGSAATLGGVRALAAASPSAMPTFRTLLEVRLACRENRLPIYASRALGGFLCVNIVMMAQRYADEFRRFCTANPVSCPLLHEISAGRVDAPTFARDLDVRTDLRSYDVLRNGEMSGSVPDVTQLFTPDTVTFFVGSSVSLDGYLVAKDMGPSWGPCIYLTTRACTPVGRYRGNMAVTMRTYRPELVQRVAEVTSHYPACHGAPLEIDRPEALGIAKDTKPFVASHDHGEPPAGHPRVYWACGITPSLVAKAAKLPLMIVHTPGNALITDIPTESLHDRWDMVAGLAKPKAVRR